MSQHKDASNTRIKEQTSMGDIVMGVCYRLPDREEQADEALCRQTGAASRSQALSSWKTLVLESTDDNFFTQVIEEPMRTDALLDCILTDKEGLTGDVKAEGSLCCSDQEMVEILRGGSRTKCKLTTLERDQTLASSKICSEEYHGIRLWRKDRPKKAG